MGLDRSTQVDQEKTIGKVFVFEVGDLDALVSLLLIGPLDHFLVRLVVNQLQVVDPHKLPHECQGQLLVSILDVLGANAHSLAL